MHKNEQKLGDLISSFAHSERVKEKLYQQKLENQWELLFGKTVKDYTTKIQLRRRSLTLWVNSAPLRQELHMGQKKLIAIVNAELKEEYVESVRILPA